MNKKIIALLLILTSITAIGIWLLLNQDLVRNFSEMSLTFVEEKIGRNVNTGGEPLRKETDDVGALLTVKGAIAETNRHRQEAGLPSLRESTVLNISAQKKVDDMFRRQYFEHDAPTGEGAGDLVEDEGYVYILVGENLALGNYKNDQVLVQAWMDSPGHRENILKPSYTEIGIAVARGEFEGRDTWLAVQHFAKPTSDCPDIDASLKTEIDSSNTKIAELKSQLETKKKELETKPTNHEESEEYNKKVDDYNNLVNEYNALVQKTKDLIGQYNNQVQIFNNCAKT